MPQANPWGALSPAAGSMVGSRVDPAHPRAWWWCVEPGGRYGLALYGISAKELPQDLSSLTGLSVSIRQQPSDGTYLLLLLLESGAEWQLFHTLCVDLVESTANSVTPDDAVNVAVTRLRRWQRLLSRGKTPGLTDEAARGLLAELLFLRDELVGRVGIQAAIGAWTGPHDHPQDFAVEDRAFEIKSHLNSARQVVSISSLEQLESTAPKLFLVVQDLSISSPDTAGTVSLATLVADIRALARAAANEALDHFDESLELEGYEDNRPYGRTPYLEAGRRFFQVAEGFPRIIRSGVASEIPRAAYALDVSLCGRFLTTNPWV
jgi:hypothetical protein